MHTGTAIRTGLVAAAVAIVLATAASVSAHDPPYTRSFTFGECGGFSSTGRNPFFVLEPGNKLVLEGREDGELVRVSITVTDKTRTINGVETRVVRERETHDGELVEISRNFFAICNRNNSVVYFGEEVDFYEDGEIVGHEGSWHAGTDGARAGIVMPGVVLIGSRYFQEFAPDVALDRAEIIGLRDTVETPAGTFDDCLKTKETTELEPGAEEFKWYAPGVGLVQDGDLKLIETSDGS